MGGVTTVPGFGLREIGRLHESAKLNIGTKSLSQDAVFRFLNGVIEKGLKQVRTPAQADTFLRQLASSADYAQLRGQQASPGYALATFLTLNSSLYATAPDGFAIADAAMSIKDIRFDRQAIIDSALDQPIFRGTATLEDGRKLDVYLQLTLENGEIRLSAPEERIRLSDLEQQPGYGMSYWYDEASGEVRTVFGGPPLPYEVIVDKAAGGNCGMDTFSAG